MKIISKKIITLIAGSCCLVTVACGNQSTETAPSSTQTISPSPNIIVGSPYAPSAEEKSTNEAEAAIKAPSISSEDYTKGMTEGNIYVVYSNVMCFGATLDTPEDYKRYQHTTQEVSDYESMYALIPDEVLNQSQLNKEGKFEVAQGCYDAGWINPGAV